MNEHEQPCKKRWLSHKNQRISTLKKLWKAYCEGEDSAYYKKIDEEYGNLFEYGLCFDYVAPGTFTDQNEGYWRYQLSYGGPSDEFRFYASGLNGGCYRIEYVFLDWYDGSVRGLKGKDLEFLEEIWTWFRDSGMVENTYNTGMEGI